MQTRRPSQQRGYKMNQGFRKITVAFSSSAALALGGCASTMNYTGKEDCVERNGKEVTVNLLVARFVVSDRKDQFKPSCAGGLAAAKIATMKKADGTPDLAAYLLALNLYRESNDEFKKSFDRQLKDEHGMTIKDIEFALKSANGDMVCDIVEKTEADGTTSTAARCVPMAATKPKP